MKDKAMNTEEDRAYQLGIEDFKSALREEIENEIRYYQSIDLTDRGKGVLATWQHTLQLLDQVKPPKK